MLVSVSGSVSLSVSVITGTSLLSLSLTPSAAVAVTVQGYRLSDTFSSSITVSYLKVTLSPGSSLGMINALSSVSLYSSLSAKMNFPSSVSLTTMFVSV